ncbi:uncharacterized protein H6S33_008141 [Morchella sextelata]|uniref:uncharacterized protein n=1 Tax=Morchella sextelata TaxID=1174677 RepID=UPI001D04C9D9|nr:uncharacterized protein H6S33_008141 [Morchella sextelata]KAH0603137.1 hypothetical protein H6S33_008141 [Morchella sextelata]
MSSSSANFNTVAEYAAALAEDPYEFVLTDSMTALCGATSASDSDRDYENEFKDVAKESVQGNAITKVSNIQVSESRTPFPLVDGPASNFPTQQNPLLSSRPPSLHRFPPLTPTSIANTRPLRHVPKSRKLGDSQSSMEYQNDSMNTEIGAECDTRSSAYQSHRNEISFESNNDSVEGSGTERRGNFRQNRYQQLTQRLRHPNNAQLPQNRSRSVGVTSEVGIKQANQTNNSTIGAQQFKRHHSDRVKSTSSNAATHDHCDENKNAGVAATDTDHHEEGGQSSMGRVKDFGKRMFKKVKGEVNTGSGKVARGHDASV